MKKWIGRIFSLAVIIVLVFSPYLLIIDFERYSPVVLLIWFVSVAYYLFLKRKVDQRIEAKQKLDSDNNESEKSENDVSRETISLKLKKKE